MRASQRFLQRSSLRPAVSLGASCHTTRTNTMVKHTAAAAAFTIKGASLFDGKVNTKSTQYHYTDTASATYLTMPRRYSSTGGESTGSSIYDFTVKDGKRQNLSLSEFKGKAVLIMNVASKCGFTKSGYTAATELYDKYKDKDFTVLAFPCNQFGSQEPGTEDEIKDFACTKFKADFPVMAKIDVNGEKAIPLYNFLKHAVPGSFGSEFVKWNFTSFLTDKDGKPVKRYSPGTSAATMEADLLPLLAPK